MENETPMIIFYRLFVFPELLDLELPLDDLELPLDDLVELPDDLELFPEERTPDDPDDLLVPLLL